MSAASQKRQLKSNRTLDYSYWMEPKRRFYICLFVFVIFGVLQRWNWIFSLGTFGTIAVHAAIALYTGDIYVRKLSLKSGDAIYTREDSAYVIILFVHLAILLLFLLTLFLRICGL
jgi:hypothetical protein